jgi:DNA-binding XRE family transcriptional regulator
MLNNQTHPHLIEAYKKSLNTIESCKTIEQLEVAFKLVENFKKMYKQVGYPKALSYSLSRAINKKSGSLGKPI